MGLLIIILLAIQAVLTGLLCYILISIEKWLAYLSGLDLEEPEEEAKATDPFQKPKEIYQSTSHIIVPKTPTEIRNQNFKKIREGIEYGDISRG